MAKPTLAIVGVGLIGGSLGQAWRRVGAARVIGVVRRSSAVAEVLAAGAADEATTDLAAAAAAADVTIFCTPVMDIVPLALSAARSARPGAIFSDAGSTKLHICTRLWEALPPAVTFIGGHPMAGSEKTGVGAADPYLFENAVYCFTPPPGPRYAAPLQKLLDLAQAAGARPMVLAPAVHDLIVAGVSHVPHLVAVALVQAVARAEAEGEPMLQLAAGGFRDTTRVAGGPSDVWRDICLTNQPAILQMLDGFGQALAELRQAVAAQDAPALMRLFDKAREVRRTIPTRSRGVLGSLGEITLIMADKPGEIHTVSGILAAAGINICDIEILRVREGEAGTARLAFAGSEAADQAVTLLCANGYTARRI